MLNNDTINVIKTDKQIIVLNSVNYTDDEDKFMNNFKAELACQAEKEKYSLLAQKYMYMFKPNNIGIQYFKIEPLLLTIDNDNAHLYGWFEFEKEYNIPSYINTNSIMKRYLWVDNCNDHAQPYLSLHNNKLIYNNYSRRCSSWNIVSNAQKTYMIVNIFFKLY